MFQYAIPNPITVPSPNIPTPPVVDMWPPKARSAIMKAPAIDTRARRIATYPAIRWYKMALCRIAGVNCRMASRAAGRMVARCMMMPA